MRLLIQRVRQAKVEIDGKTISEIGCGLLVFVGICDNDTDTDIDYLSSKLVNLRIFDDSDGVMNRSSLDTDASKPDIAVPVYEKFCREVSRKLGKNVYTGVFGADMQVSLTNNGPVTIWIDSSEKNN